MAEESYRACNCAKLCNGYTRAPNEKNRRGRQVVAADDRGYGRRLSHVRGLTVSANAGRASITNPQTIGVDAPFYENLS